MRKTLLPTITLLIATGFSSCEHADDRNHILEISEKLEKISISVASLKEQQEELFARVRENEGAQKSQDSASEFNQKSIQLKLDELMEVSTTLTSHSESLVEWSKVEPEKLELLAIDLSDVGREISDRIRSIKKKHQVITLDQKKSIDLLRLKQSTLSRIFYSRSITGRHIERDESQLSEEELEKVKKLREEIEDLEEEVGYLVIKSTSSFGGTDIARKYLVEKFNGTQSIVVNHGFSGSGERILYMPEGMNVIDLTPTIVKEILEMDDNDEIFHPEG